MIHIDDEVYDGIIMKPDLDNALEHYGVKGMKWRKKRGLHFKRKRKTMFRSFMKGDSRYLTDKAMSSILSRPEYSNMFGMKGDPRYKDLRKSSMIGDSRYKNLTKAMAGDPRYKKQSKKFTGLSTSDARNETIRRKNYKKDKARLVKERNRMMSEQGAKNREAKKKKRIEEKKKKLGL